MEQNYSEAGKVSLEGNIIDGVKQGNWNTLSYYGDISETHVYKDGKIVKSISYLNEHKNQFKMSGSSKYDLVKYLNSQLSKVEFKKPNEGVVNVLYSFTIMPNGKLINPAVSESGTPEIDSAIIKELLAAPNWQPVVKSDILKRFLLTTVTSLDNDGTNGKGRCFKIPLEFMVEINDKGKINISYSPITIYKYN